MRTRSNSFLDALFWSWTVAPYVGLFSKLPAKATKPSKPTENKWIFDSFKFNQSILFARKSVVSFISVAYLVHNKKMNVHIIDSNSVMKKCLIQQPKWCLMSNTPPDIADDNRNNCPVTINYENTIKKNC
jgi:hypothetical protein